MPLFCEEITISSVFVLVVNDRKQKPCGLGWIVLPCLPGRPKKPYDTSKGFSMRLKNYVSGLLAGALLVGCSASRTTSFNSLQVGMKKPEVILMMGEPDATKTGQGIEYIIYEFMGPLGVSKCVVAAFTPIPGLVPFICKQNKHFIKLEGHLVKSFGRVMDIDIEKDPNAGVLTD